MICTAIYFISAILYDNAIYIDFTTPIYRDGPDGQRGWRSPRHGPLQPAAAGRAGFASRSHYAGPG